MGKNITSLLKWIWFSFILSRDRFRTAVNVMGDVFGTGIVEHLSRDDLRKKDDFEMIEEGHDNRNKEHRDEDENNENDDKE